MASLFKPHSITYRLPDGSYRTPDGKRVTKNTPGALKVDSGPSAIWYGRYKAADGFHRVALCSDKTASKEMLSKLVTDAKFAQLGMVNAFKEQHKRPLAQHLEDWEKHLLRKRSRPGNARQETARARRIIDACKFLFIPDVQADRVEECIADLQEQDGFGTQTANYYLRTVKQFFRWLVRDRRTNETPLAHLEGGNADEDRRHKHRALPSVELAELLAATRISPSLFRGLNGEDRLMLYATAMGTGLRVSELASLLPSSFHLQADPPVVHLQAVDAKNRKEVDQPLPPALAGALAEYLAGKPPDLPVWAGTWVEKAAKMLRADLAAAGIPYRDAEGRVADFHSLRHSYITLLSRSGVSPKLAQELARHSDIRLTMNVYTHAGLYDLGGAVQNLPSLLPGSRPEAMIATGTDGAPGPRLDQTGEIRCCSVITPDNEGKQSSVRPDCHKTAENTANDNDCEPLITPERNTPGGIRTPNLRLRRPLLCPVELQALIFLLQNLMSLHQTTPNWLSQRDNRQPSP